MSAPLLPIVPILLLPFILVAFVVGLPVWLATLLVLGLLRLLVWPLERLLASLGAGREMRGSARLAAAYRWVSTLGGLTERRVGSGAPASEDGRGAAAAPGGPRRA